MDMYVLSQLCCEKHGTMTVSSAWTNRTIRDTEDMKVLLSTNQNPQYSSLSVNLYSMEDWCSCDVTHRSVQYIYGVLR